MYQYTADLLQLNAVSSSSVSALPSQLHVINTPLQADAWQRCLEKHPDLDYVHYILTGIREGFRIGFNLQQPLQKSRRNMQSAYSHREVVAKQLTSDCQKGFTLGPFAQSDFPHIHSSRIGVIPKKHQQGKFRLIVDLSSPSGKSINDGIGKEFCSLSYTRVDEIVDSVLYMGRGTLLAKSDIKSAFRIVPVHPADRHLLGMEWDNQLYIDATLPFGLRSAPKIFNALADALEWVIRQHGVAHIWHYLDDFLMAGAQGTDECLNSLHTFFQLCALLGVPLAVEKSAGPATVLAILGIGFDTDKMMLFLPADKLERVSTLLADWEGKKKCTKRELQSLIGQLQHVATIVKPGRTFLRRMYDLLSVAEKPHHHIRLNQNFKSDLAWWVSLLSHWEGSAMMSTSCPPPPNIIVTSDASGNWGCGAYWANWWFQLAWPDNSASQSIMFKELAAIVIATAIWGHKWRYGVVLCRCDNSAVVSVLRSRTSHEKEAMHLLRCLHFYEAFYECRLVSEHLPGVDNDLADDLSRNRLPSFLQKAPEASKTSAGIPPALIELLLQRKPDWLSSEWRELFRATLSSP